MGCMQRKQTSYDHKFTGKFEIKVVRFVWEWLDLRQVQPISFGIRIWNSDWELQQHFSRGFNFDWWKQSVWAELQEEHNRENDDGIEACNDKQTGQHQKDNGVDISSDKENGGSGIVELFFHILFVRLRREVKDELYEFTLLFYIFDWLIHLGLQIRAYLLKDFDWLDWILISEGING